jgi:hypothetical protein
MFIDAISGIRSTLVGIMNSRGLLGWIRSADQAALYSRCGAAIAAVVLLALNRALW